MIRNHLPLFLLSGMRPSYSEDRILQGIRDHESRILEHVYQVYFPVIESFVIHNQGNSHQAKDVFQEGMIIVYNKLRGDGRELAC